MKRIVVLIVGVLGICSVRVLQNQAVGSEPTNTQQSSPLPASLDKLYPPQSSGPAWLLAMLGMGTSFSGMVTDFMEGDFANAEHGYADFRTQYAKLSQMVPEWAGDCPAEPIDALGSALESRDPAKFMPAVERASKVCHACHVQNMTRVQQKYHWDDFGVITLTDPISKQNVPFTVFMQMLEGDLSGVGVDLGQGQLDQARHHAAGLAARYHALEEACTACHDTERKYYVDSGIKGMIRDLDGVLAKPTVDPMSVQKLVQGIGMESCHKCHLVHGPAALARYLSVPGK